MVSCCLWFPDANGLFNAVQLTTLAPEEWAGLSEWARPRCQDLPGLAGLLSAALPVQVAPTDLPGLLAECQRVDWDSLSGPALGGFASLSGVVSQAAAQAHAGLRFAR